MLSSMESLVGNLIWSARKSYMYNDLVCSKGGLLVWNTRSLQGCFRKSLFCSENGCVYIYIYMQWHIAQKEDHYWFNQWFISLSIFSFKLIYPLFFDDVKKACEIAIFCYHCQAVNPMIWFLFIIVEL